MTDMRDSNSINPIGACRWFGRHYCKDPMHSTIGNTYEICVEIALNMTGCIPAAMGGVPLVRGSAAGGGAHCAYLNTQVTGGADAGTSTNGCFENVFGVALIEFTGTYMDHPDYLMLWVPELTTAPANGVTLTQLTSLATGIVRNSNTTDNWILIEDLHTGTWDTTNTFTESGATMAPTPLTPRTVDWRVTACSNLYYDATKNPLIPVGIRGYFEARFIADPAGTGYNGALVDKTSVTYNDDVAAFCKADYHDVTIPGDNGTAVYVNPDNVYGHTMETIGANVAHVPEIGTGYFKFNEPNVFTGDVGYADQGVDEEIQR